MRQAFLAGASAAALTALSAGSAAAQTATWTAGTSSDWTINTNWSPTTLPGSTSNVVIENTSGSQPILGVSGPQNVTIANFTIGPNGGSGANTLMIENGSVLTSTGSGVNIGVAAGGTATVTVTGAGSQWNTAANVLTVGAGASTGILNILDGGSVNAPTLRVGPTTGTGTVNIENGTVVTSSATVRATSRMNFDNAILRASASSASWLTSTGTLNILAGGVTIDSNGFNVGTTAASVFSGAGGLTKIGSGVLTLAGANTYTGDTVIQAGTLALTGAGSVASSHRVVDNATFDVSGATSATIKSLAGTGGVTLGANTLTVTNANDQFSGIIAGTGGLNLTAGMLDLTGANTYSGATSVNGGALRVDGSIASSTLTTVHSGATLTGTGTVGATQVDTGGTFAPGSGTFGGSSANTPPAPGSSMTVAGNLAFQTGSFYLVSVNLSNASFANVTGTAALNGTVQAYVDGATSNKPYEILHSAGLNGSTFSGLTLVNSNFRGSLTYTATDVYLTLTADIGAGPSGIPPPCAGTFTQNQCNVAVSLNTFFNNGGSLTSSFANVFGLTGSQLGNALYHLDGEAATGAERASFQLTNEFLALMLDPFVYGRSGGFGGGGGGAIAFAPEQQDSLPPDVALAYASIVNKAPVLPSFDQRWTAWGASYGGSSNTKGDQANTGSTNVNANTYGFAGGMDYHVTPTTVFGFALAGAGTNWASRMRSAPAAATRCRRACTASLGSARPTWLARCLSAITGSPPVARRWAIR
jgi:autotransporter-associated beta strand protein/T5SS/PEP-CTERM-associated repeat protein